VISEIHGYKTCNNYTHKLCVSFNCELNLPSTSGRSVCLCSLSHSPEAMCDGDFSRI
jgi:hypothetical protein